MRFDGSSTIQNDVRTTLGLDPRMIKFSSVKLGDGKLDSLAKIDGKMWWNNTEKNGSAKLLLEGEGGRRR